jgi:hypothetical protein
MTSHDEKAPYPAYVYLEPFESKWSLELAKTCPNQYTMVIHLTTLMTVCLETLTDYKCECCHERGFLRLSGICTHCENNKTTKRYHEYTLMACIWARWANFILFFREEMNPANFDVEPEMVGALSDVCDIMCGVCEGERDYFTNLIETREEKIERPKYTQFREYINYIAIGDASDPGEHPVIPLYIKDQFTKIIQSVATWRIEQLPYI